MTCDVTLRDPRTVARIVNLAHRFTCRTTTIDARDDGTNTTARFAFTGPPRALERLKMQIDRVVASEGTA